VFCGDDTVPLTKEHIFADWIADLYGRMPTGISQVVDHEGNAKTWSKNAFQDTVRIVCQERCNGGWMSNLEQRTKPILGPIITKGWTTPLSPASQATIAFWAVKTALVLDHFYQAVRVVPDSEYPALYAAQQPLRSHMVWIARRNSPGDNLASSLKQQVGEIQIPADNPQLEAQVRADIASGKVMYRITFSVGYLVLQVFGQNLTGGVNITEGTGNVDIAHRIWPSQGQITWPPAKSIEIVGGLPGFHGMFGGPPAPVAPPPTLAAPPRLSRKERRAAERAARKLRG